MHPDRTPGQMKQWIDSLSLSDVHATVTQLHEVLASQNKFPLDNEEQIDLLETYRELADEILMSYDDITLRTLPLEPEQRGQLSQSITGIFLSLSRGYHTAIERADTAHETPSESAWLLLATYRAMEYLALAALYSCKLRADIPAVVWSASKKLYLFAERHNVTGKKIRKAADHAVPPTIETLFKQLMLFAVADPYRWPSAEVHELFLCLETYAPSVLFTSSGAPLGGLVYQLDMENDTAPHLLLLDIPAPIAANVRGLDCAPALAHIKQDIEKSGSSVDALSHDREGRLLAEFYKRTRAPRMRSEPRTATQHPVRIAIGLDATCYFLSHPAHAHRDQQCHLVSGIEVCEDENAFEMTQWTTVNENVNGYMLVADGETTHAQPPAGEVLALADHDLHGTPRLRVGFVRWVRKLKSASVSVGVEILEGEPQPARCARTSMSTQGTATAAIFFPARKGQSPALLIPAWLYAPAATVSVEIGTENKLLDMDLPLSESPLYVLAAVLASKR